MAPSEREPFEAFVRSKMSDWVAVQDITLRKCVVEGEVAYADPVTQMRWEAWQNSKNLDSRAIFLTILLLTLAVIIQGYFLIGYESPPTLVFNTKPTWTLMNFADRGTLFEVNGGRLTYYYAGPGGWVLRCMEINYQTGIVQPSIDPQCTEPYVRLNKGVPSEHSSNPKP